ncbi:MAG TPA: hypothetical protein VHJ19_03870 [Gammaproteobacteria bacterium]|nr:hypothetical protein [Gammaproteobacteria bacterium]
MKPEPSDFAAISHHIEAELQQKIAELPPSVRRIIAAPYEAPSIEAWEAEVRAEQERRRRERENEHPDLRLIEGSNKP